MFDSTHEVLLANTEAARVIHRKIRYHVYCLERRFENPARYPTGQEHDHWDSHAAPFIVRERATGAWVATLRLVLPEATRFPLETLRCLPPESPHSLQRRQFAEISRICVINSASPHTINHHLDQNFGPVSRHGESEILLGMIRAIVIYGLERDIEHCYLLVTEAFARLLRRLGVVLHRAGKAIEHRGLRTPYRVGLRENAAALSARSPAISQLFARRALAYQPFSALTGYRSGVPAGMLARPGTDTPTRPGAQYSRPGPGVWRLEMDPSKPGPGHWRGTGLNTRPG